MERKVGGGQLRSLVENRFEKSKAEEERRVEVFEIVQVDDDVSLRILNLSCGGRGEEGS